jgi:cytochrome c-type biogenesis protein
VIQGFVDQLNVYLQGAHLLAYPAVYLGGVLVSFTPCTYPILPVVAAYCGAYSGASRRQSLMLSFSYVLGMALTYTLLGGIAALTGRLFGSIQSSPWTYFFVANLFLFMGLSMLDVFAFSIAPPFAARWMTGAGRKGMAGSFFVGATSGLVMGPCTAPVFAVLMAYVAAGQNLFHGMSLLFVFSLGMGTLPVLVGVFSGLLASLPRSGEWMVKIKKIFGWVFIGLGEYFLIEAGRLWF